jgi:hypothetical protein
MVNFPSKKKKAPTGVVVNMIWISTFLAMIFTLPSLAIFLGIYYGTGNLVLGAVLGFGVHVLALVFSGRISKLQC